MDVRLALAACDIVGESAVWDDRRQRLVWVDIIGRRVHAFDPATARHQIWPLGGRPTSVGLRADGGAILGMERDVCLWDWQGEPKPLAAIEQDRADNRLNEGVVGPDGAFWVGTMLNNINEDDSPRDIATATGSIYRCLPDGRVTRVTDDLFGINNTLAFPHPGALLTADTLANAIYTYKIGADGRLHDRKTLQSGFPRGLPDGSCLDAEGRLWSARVAGGACLTCLTRDGNLAAIVELPCSWPTSCCFGGPNLSTLFVTSARFTMTPEHLTTNPQEGGLFALDLGVRGLPAHRFGVTA
jgi:sugar lactone lactonase YvrE